MVKRLARYINSQKDRGLIYRNAKDFTSELVSHAYCDASLNVKATSGVAVFIGKPDPVNHINDSAAIMVLTKIE
jgi:hypothetical protein